MKAWRLEQKRRTNMALRQRDEHDFAARILGCVLPASKARTARRKRHREERDHLAQKLRILSGFYADPSTWDTATQPAPVRCPFPSTCVGSAAPLTQCLNGSTGPLCGGCAGPEPGPAYYRTDRTCLLCPQTSGSLAFTIFCIVLGIGAVLFAVFLYIRPHVGPILEPFVALYAAALACMGIAALAAAAAASGGRSRKPALAGAVGALVFVASDTILAVNKFVYRGSLPHAKLLPSAVGGAGGRCTERAAPGGQ